MFQSKARTYQFAMEKNTIERNTGFGVGSSHHCLLLTSMFSRWLPHDDVGGNMPFWEANRDSPCTFKVISSLSRADGQDHLRVFRRHRPSVDTYINHPYRHQTSLSIKQHTHIYFTHIFTTIHIYFPSPPTQITSIMSDALRKDFSTQAKEAAVRQSLLRRTKPNQTSFTNAFF